MRGNPCLFLADISLVANIKLGADYFFHKEI